MVYIDDAQIAYRGMLMCHMWADTDDELHAMAQRLGLRRAWHDGDAILSHYDVCLSKRRLAVKLGAKLVDSSFLKQRIRLARSARQNNAARAI
jgi:hypothetical protein